MAIDKAPPMLDTDAMNRLCCFDARAKISVSNAFLYNITQQNI